MRPIRGVGFVFATMAVVLFACSSPSEPGGEPPERVGETSEAVTSCPPSGNLAIDGNFESQLTGWTTAGSVTATPYAYSGYYAAQVGSTAPYNGDSTISQKIVVPSCGKARLSFYWKGSCTDSFAYDQQTAQIVDSTGKALVTIFNTCQTTAWAQVIQDLSPYRGQTITLRFNDHDDNYPTDPTYFSVDNVVVNNRVDDYQSYLTGNPQVLTDAMTAYGSQRGTFSAADYQTLYNAAGSLEQFGTLPTIDPAENTVLLNCIKTSGNPFNCDNYFQARNLAYALWLELNQMVPWSLAADSNDNLQQILSLIGKPHGADYYPLLVRPDYVRTMWMTYAMPGQSLTTRADLVNRLATWIRSNIIHEEGGPQGDGNELVTDIAQFLNGTRSCQSQTADMCIGSCHHNNHFMEAVAVAFNLPAVSTWYQDPDSLATHDFIDFPRDTMALIHSDDLYSYNSLQNVPISQIFLTGNDRTVYLGATVAQYYTNPSPPNPTQADRTHYTHNAGLYFQYPDTALLQHVCQGSSATMTWLQGQWAIPSAVMSDVSAYYTTWQSSLKTKAGCP